MIHILSKNLKNKSLKCDYSAFASSICNKRDLNGLSEFTLALAVMKMTQSGFVFSYKSVYLAPTIQ